MAAVHCFAQPAGKIGWAFVKAVTQGIEQAAVKIFAFMTQYGRVIGISGKALQAEKQCLGQRIAGRKEYIGIQRTSLQEKADSRKAVGWASDG